MLNLFPEAAGIGAGLGGLAGSALSGISDVLSAPRRALWSLAGAGDKSGSDVMGDLGMDKESLLAKALGLGLEVATDPLTYAGGFLGRMGGKAAGTALSGAAEAAGPGYAGGAAKLTQGLEGEVPSALQHVLGGSADDLARVSAELAPGSKVIGSGAEGAAYLSPSGNVTRIERGFRGAAPEARVAAPEVLQPARNVTAGEYRLEHLPRVEVGGTDAAARALEQSAAGRGLGVVDSNLASNLGVTREGRALTFDPGVYDWNGAAGPLAPSVTLGQGGPTSYLARLLGGQQRLRRHLETPFSTIGQGI